MRLVLDTNVILSGLLWHGAPHEILDRVRSGAVSLISSPALLAELAEVLGRAKFVTILARAGIRRVSTCWTKCGSSWRWLLRHRCQWLSAAIPMMM